MLLGLLVLEKEFDVLKEPELFGFVTEDLMVE